MIHIVLLCKSPKFKVKKKTLKNVQPHHNMHHFAIAIIHKRLLTNREMAAILKTNSVENPDFSQSRTKSNCQNILCILQIEPSDGRF